MKRHIEKTRAHLGELHGLAAKTEAAEHAILKSAKERLAAVNGQLQRLRPGIEAAPENSQERYTDLVAEAGQLQLVIGKAKAALQTE